MNVMTYDLRKTDPRTRLTRNINLGELRCSDGSPIVLVDLDLLAKEQACRDYFGQPIIFSSFYRTLAYNTKIGGAKESWHVDGRAGDKDIGAGKYLVDPRIVAMYDDAIGQYGGIGLYLYPDGRSWVHNDSGPRGKYWIAKKPGSANYQYIDTFLPILKRQLIPIYRFECEVMQHLLIRCGYAIKVDGKFGPGTDRAVRLFQKDNGLVASIKDRLAGIIGCKTWTKLFEKSATWI
jgi:peptidoglycan hydrolase-like protein with peptidoglycan-binding domain